MAVNLDEALRAGPAGDFFERVMAAPDDAPPQFVNVHRAIQRAAESGDAELQRWARDMNAAIDRTAEGVALRQQQAGNPLDGIMASVSNIIAAIQGAFSDGFQLSDLGTIMSAFNGSADPAAQRAAQATQALEDANARLGGLTQDQRNRLGITEDQANAAITRIDGIAPRAPAGPGA